MATNTRSNARSLGVRHARSEKRKPADRILIVTEGERTEPRYFNDLKKTVGGGSVRIEVIGGNTDTCPSQLIERAERLVRDGDTNRGHRAKEWEHVYIVFDRDHHSNFATARNKIQKLDSSIKNELKKPIRFSSIYSIPSFELWILLHFRFTDAPMSTNEALAEVRRVLPNYRKEQSDLYSQLQRNLNFAIQNAQRLEVLSHAEDACTNHPETKVHLLVKHLLSFRPQTIA